jgi:hypothetical protein
MIFFKMYNKHVSLTAKIENLRKSSIGSATIGPNVSTKNYVWSSQPIT